MKLTLAAALCAAIGGCSKPRVESDGDGRPPPSHPAESAESSRSSATLPPARISGLLPRMGHAVAVLADGRGFVAGGHDLRLTGVSQCQSFDPRTRTWTNEGGLAPPASFSMVVALPHEAVLVAGGIEELSRSSASAHRCDLQHHRCASIGKMHDARAHGSAVSFADGRVLVVGGADFALGRDGRALATAEELDPRSDTWSTVANLHQARAAHRATLLKDGSVLISGGRPASEADPAFASLELYDPQSKTFRDAAPMKLARAQHTATLLADGRVLLAGGVVKYGEVTATAEIFDPATGQTTATGSMTERRRQHEAIRLRDGRVWVVGGEDSGKISFNLATATTELFDPGTGQWRAGPSLATARSGVQILALDERHLLAFGGYTGQAIIANEEILEAPPFTPR